MDFEVEKEELLEFLQNNTKGWEDRLYHLKHSEKLSNVDKFNLGRDYSIVLPWRNDLSLSYNFDINHFNKLISFQSGALSPIENNYSFEWIKHLYSKFGSEYLPYAQEGMRDVIKYYHRKVDNMVSNRGYGAECKENFKQELNNAISFANVLNQDRSLDKMIAKVSQIEQDILNNKKYTPTDQARAMKVLLTIRKDIYKIFNGRASDTPNIKNSLTDETIRFCKFETALLRKPCSNAMFDHNLSMIVESYDNAKEQDLNCDLIYKTSKYSLKELQKNLRSNPTIMTKYRTRKINRIIDTLDRKYEQFNAPDFQEETVM